MQYAEALDYLYTHLPMYQRVGPAAYKKDLTNTLKLCAHLGDPQNTFHTIHVGGTNGKGSVSNMLCSVLMEAGYTTGLYTSPHLLDFRERIRVDGQMCDTSFVVDFVEKMRPLIEEVQPSFFELTVVMAFLWFAECGVDTAVIEVGLGGRLDSTNVITPDLSIITNISLEHQAMLGDTIEKIAFEKAGIIKPHVPVVIGEKNASFSVFMQQAEEKQATLFLAEENVSCNLLAGDNGNMELDISYLQRLLYPELLCSLTGTYQRKNVSTVVQAVEVLRSGDYDISDDAVYNGLARIQQNTGFAGRWQIVAQQPTIICDCAHNAAGLQEVFRQVDRLVYNTLHIVTGAVHDKDISANLSCFPQKAQYYFTRPDVPRGLDANILQQEASAFGLSGQAYPQVRAAVDAARKNAGADDLILICGSIFVVAEALPIFSEM